MKAAVVHDFTQPLSIENVPRPEPGNAAEQDPTAEIQKLGGADAAIALAVSPRPFEQAFDSLARGGTLLMVALPPDNYVKLPIFETVLRGINVKGSIVGAHRDVEDAYKLHTLGRTRLLHETFRKVPI